MAEVQDTPGASTRPGLDDFNSVVVPSNKDPVISECIVTEGHRMPDGQVLGMTVNFIEENITVTTVEQLGKGGFSHVYKARAANGQTYALKVSNKELTDAEWKRLNEEVAIMQLMSRHPNVVHIVAAAKDEKKAYILMERCHYMTLTEVLQKRPLSRGEVLWIGHALVSSIAYIHNKGCIHRDLKPSNLLFDFDGNLKVTDFGLSTRTQDNEPRKSVVGTAMYMIPEMATQVHRHFSKQRTEVINYGPEVDVWGVGIVLYAMMTGKLPYSDLAAQLKASGLPPREQQVQLLDAVAKMQWKWPNNYFGDTALTNLVEHILHRDPKQRATLQQVLANALWNERPHMAPPSLMRLLSLLKEIKTPSRGGGGHLAAAGGSHSNGSSPIQNRTGSRGSLSRLPENTTPAAHRAKMTESEYFDCVADKIYEAEEDGRADIFALHADALAMFTFIDAEIIARRDIMDEERLMRESFANLFKAKLPPVLQRAFESKLKGSASSARTFAAPDAPASLSSLSIYRRAASRQRQPSLSYLESSSETIVVNNSHASTLNNTMNSALMTPNLRAQMHAATARGSSQPMFSGNFNASAGNMLSPDEANRTAPSMGGGVSSAVKMVRAPSTSGQSPNLYLEYTGRANSTKWSLRERVKVPEHVAEMITPQYKCLNKHVMEVHHSVPSRFEGIYCNGCNKYFSHDSKKSVCLYRCNRCDFDICLACVSQQKEISNLVECPTCSKKFVTKAKMNSHKASCRGPSTARVSASPMRSTPNRKKGGSDDDNSSPLTHSGRRSVLDNLPPTMTSEKKKTNSKAGGGGKAAAVTSAATPNNSFSNDGSASPDFRLSTNSLFEAANTRPTVYEFDDNDTPAQIVVKTFVAGADGKGGGGAAAAGGRASSSRASSRAAKVNAAAVFDDTNNLTAVSSSAVAAAKRPRAQLVEIDDDSVVLPRSTRAGAGRSKSSAVSAVAGGGGDARSASRLEVSVAVDDSTTKVFGEEDEDGEGEGEDGEPKPHKGRRTEAPTPSLSAAKSAGKRLEGGNSPASPNTNVNKKGKATPNRASNHEGTGMPSPDGLVKPSPSAVGKAGGASSSSSASSATKASPRAGSRSVSMPATGAGTINFNLQGAEKPAEGQRQPSMTRKQRGGQPHVLNTAVSADDEKKKLEEQQKFRNAASVPPALTGRSLSPSSYNNGSRPPAPNVMLPGLITSQPRITSLPNNANVINLSATPGGRGGAGGGVGGSNPVPPPHIMASTASATPSAAPPDTARPSTLDGSAPFASRTGGPLNPVGGGGGGGGGQPYQYYAPSSHQNQPYAAYSGGSATSSAAPPPPQQQHFSSSYGHATVSPHPSPYHAYPPYATNNHSPQQYYHYGGPQQQQHMSEMYAPQMMMPMMHGGVMPPTGMPPPPTPPSHGPSVAYSSSSSSNATTAAQGGRGRLPAFLNLPQDPNSRQQFLDSFLVGPWVRTFSFARTDPSHLLYYTMQPGRYGCFFAVDEGTGTMVVDINSRMVLVVPKILQKDTPPRQCDNPHVSTFFDDDIYIISLQQAMHEYKPFVEGIVNYARKILGARAANTVASDTFYSAHIYAPNETSVPPQTKFTYIRRVFPDPSRTLTMFRLSNQRTQIVASAEMEIRWQSDRANNVGMKYYVFADGRTSPMERDDYGILSRIDTVLWNAYRK